MESHDKLISSKELLTRRKKIFNFCKGHLMIKSLTRHHQMRNPPIMVQEISEINLLIHV